MTLWVDLWIRQWTALVNSLGNDALNSTRPGSRFTWVLGTGDEPLDGDGDCEGSCDGEEGRGEERRDASVASRAKLRNQDSGNL